MRSLALHLHYDLWRSCAGILITHLDISIWFELSSLRNTCAKQDKVCLLLCITLSLLYIWALHVDVDTWYCTAYLVWFYDFWGSCMYSNLAFWYLHMNRVNTYMQHTRKQSKVCLLLCITLSLLYIWALHVDVDPLHDLSGLVMTYGDRACLLIMHPDISIWTESTPLCNTHKNNLGFASSLYCAIAPLRLDTCI
jgi:hypothetical protein